MEQIVKSDRYLIYELLRHSVKVEAKGFCTKVKIFTGVIEQVMRDVFENKIIMVVSGRKYYYDEPSAIVRRDNGIVFVYGDIDEFDDSDEALFQDMRASAYGENINQILNRSEPSCMRTIRFEIGNHSISKGLR